jgi:hypothetical protein
MPPFLIQGKTRRAGYGAVGRDADGEYDHVGFHRFCRSCSSTRTPEAVVLKAGDAFAEIQLHAVFLMILVQQLGHLKVQRRHDLIGALDYGDPPGGDVRFSAVSSPMKPPPTMAALFAPLFHAPWRLWRPCPGWSRAALSSGSPRRAGRGFRGRSRWRSPARRSSPYRSRRCRRGGP